MPGGAQMLPLIVGAVEDNSANTPATTEVIEDAEILPDDAAIDGTATAETTDTAKAS